MAQVIIERPRHGARLGYRAQRRRNGRELGEDARRREAIHHRAAAHTKSFNDLFGPLLRLLRSNVGRPWNKVFSEICVHARHGNVAQRHLRKHVFDFVALHVIEIDGEPCFGGGSYWHGRPLADFRREQFYVCPRTGLLRCVARKSQKRRSRRRRRR